MSNEEKRVRRERAIAMRNLTDEQRDELIEAAGNVVIDHRGTFADRQKQVALARAYRRPSPKGGTA